MPITQRKTVRTGNTAMDAAQRRLDLAEALQRRALQGNPLPEGGPVQAAYGPGNAMVDLANTLAAAWGVKQANKGYQKASDAQSQAMSESIANLQSAVPDSQVAPEVMRRIKASAPDELPEPVIGRTTATRELADTMGPSGQQAVAAALLARNMPQAPPAPKYQPFGSGGLYEETTGAVAREPTEKLDLQRKTRDLKDRMKQDYNFNPATGEETPTGQPYESQEPPASMMAGGTSGLDQETIRSAAMETMIDPSRLRLYVSYGNAGKADREAIANERTKIAREAGMKPQDVVRMAMNFRAQNMTLPVLAKQKAAVQAYEGLARFNGDRLLQIIDKIDETGVPVIEGVRRLAERGVGGVDEAEFLSVLQTYQTEVARIISNPNLSGVLTDAARKEIQDVIQKGGTAEQFKRIINRLNLEMDMRGQMLDEQMQVSGASAAPELDPARAATPPPASAQTEFATEAEANAAAAAGTLKPGSKVVIGGVSGTWQ